MIDWSCAASVAPSGAMKASWQVVHWARLGP